MSERDSQGRTVRSWRGDAHGWPDAPLVQGPLRISGTVLDEGASWHVTHDRLGWSTVALLADPIAPAHVSDVVESLRLAAQQSSDPVETALLLRDVIGPRAAHIGLAIARVDPHGRLLELLNVSLPTVLVWDPVDGLYPYEPAARSLAELRSDASSDVLRLKMGAVLTLATGGVLPIDADWWALRRFVRAIGLDPLGGTVAEASPTELARLLQTSWRRAADPAGVVVIGLPTIARQVA